MFGIIAFLLAIIAAVLAWFSKTPADTAFLYAAVGFIALEIVHPWNTSPWFKRGPVA
jgi:hypothetical protein